MNHAFRIFCAVFSLAGWLTATWAAPVTSLMEDRSSLSAIESLTRQEAASQVPPEILARLRVGDKSALHQRGAALRRLLDERPNDPFVMHALATVMYHDGNAEQAQRLWRSTSQAEPNLASAALMASAQDVFVKLAEGQADAARRQLGALEKRFANDPHFQLMRAEQAMRAGNVAQAEAAFRKAHELGPKLYITALNLGRFVDAVRNDQGAAGRFYEQAAALGPSRPETWAYLASYQMRQNQPAAALDSLRRVKALDATAPLPERRLAEIASALGRHDDAVQWYRAALAIQPPVEEALTIRVALGNELLKLQRYADARREIEAVLKVRTLPPLVFALATIDEAEGKPAAAEQRYREILRLAPGHPLAANNLAMLLIKRGDGEAEALTLAEQARQALPNNAIVEGTWGCAMVANRRPKPALPVLKAVIETQDSPDAWTRYCYGKALAAEGRRKEAADQFERALRADAGFARAEEVRKLMAGLR
ncbi:MAG: tetratricopeptide repeat protein [Rubrivivax sp.]|nr:tetratricopeptide repeat protein [Rubrivivax sp.]